MIKSLTLIYLIFGFTQLVFPHGDHSVPGALPAPLNEGVVGKVKHIENSDHKHGEKHKHDEKEEDFFFEVTYMKKEHSIKIYLHTIDPKSPKVFKKLSPSKKINVEIELPRSKKKLKTIVMKAKNYWIIRLQEFKDRRFYTNISYTEKDENYKARVMIEKKK
jgi:hypothetical protein